jgi:hypothetical protein
MSDAKSRDSSTPGDVDIGPADAAALLMRCCAGTRPLRPEALQAVERLKAACREEARGVLTCKYLLAYHSATV